MDIPQTIEIVIRTSHVGPDDGTGRRRAVNHRHKRVSVTAGDRLHHDTTTLMVHRTSTSGCSVPPPMVFSLAKYTFVYLADHSWPTKWVLGDVSPIDSLSFDAKFFEISRHSLRAQVTISRCHFTCPAVEPAGQKQCVLAQCDLDLPEPAITRNRVVTAQGTPPDGSVACCVTKG